MRERDRERKIPYIYIYDLHIYGDIYRERKISIYIYMERDIKRERY